MEPFLQKSQKAQERLKGAYDRTENRCHDLVSLYCEDPAKLGIDDFFKEVLEFLQRFDRAQVRIDYTILHSSLLCSNVFLFLIIRYVAAMSEFATETAYALIVSRQHIDGCTQYSVVQDGQLHPIQCVYLTL
jgi:hypothetical protein